MCCVDRLNPYPIADTQLLGVSPPCGSEQPAALVYRSPGAGCAEKIKRPPLPLWLKQLHIRLGYVDSLADGVGAAFATRVSRAAGEYQR